MMRPKDMLPIIRASDLFLSLLAPNNDGGHPWEAAAKLRAERGLLQLVMDKLVETRLCPMATTQYPIPQLFVESMTFQGMGLNKFDLESELSLLMDRNTRVTDHMTERLSLEYLLSTKDITRHIPPATGATDSVYADRMSHVALFRKSLEEFRNNPLVRLVLDSRLAETRKIVSYLSQSSIASQIKAKSMAEDSIRREAKARSTVNLYNGCVENDKRIQEHNLKENAELRDSIKLSENFNLLNLELIAQLRREKDELESRLRAIPPPLLEFVSQYDQKSLDDRHLRKEVVRFKHAIPAGYNEESDFIRSLQCPQFEWGPRDFGEPVNQKGDDSSESHQNLLKISGAISKAAFQFPMTESERTKLSKLPSLPKETWTSYMTFHGETRAAFVDQSA